MALQTQSELDAGTNEHFSRKPTSLRVSLKSLKQSQNDNNNDDDDICEDNSLQN